MKRISKKAVVSLFTILITVSMIPFSVFATEADAESYKNKEIINGVVVKQVCLGANCSAAIAEDGSLYTWGDALLNGTTENKKIPTQLLTNESFLNVNLGTRVMQSRTISNSCGAITENGDLYLWGQNTSGTLGDGTTENSNEPKKILSNVSSVCLTDNNSAAVTKGGTLFTWGNNYFGQLGDGTTEDKLIPTKIMENVASVSWGIGGCAAITKDGNLYTWGSNFSGELGDGTKENKTTPTKILENVTSVAWGVGCCAAITTDGSLYTWGSNYSGELGDGTNESKLTPVKIMDNVTSVGMGNGFCAAITKDGDLYSWGNNRYGQLGDGTTTNTNTPKKILDNVDFISIKEYCCAAVKKDGTLYTWGNNICGNLGDGTTKNSATPKRIMENVASVNVDYGNTAAITTDGSLYTWGSNYSGELGDGTTEDKLTPTLLIFNSGKKYNGFEIGRDNNSYHHTNPTTDSKSGFGGRTDHYFSNVKYFNELTSKSSKGEKEEIVAEMKKKWNGSCYGITLSMALLNQGYINISDITNTSATTYYELNPSLNRDIKDTDVKYSNMIEYYYLSQFLNDGGESSIDISATRLFYIPDYSNDKAESLESALRKIVEKAKSQKPFLLEFGYGENHGHIIYALGCEEREDSYYIIGYDINNNSQINVNYLTIKKDYSGFVFNGSKETFNEENYNFIETINLELMKNTVVLSPNLKDFDSQFDRKSTSPSSSASSQSNYGDNTARISFYPNSSFRITNEQGEKLEYNTGRFSGDIEIISLNAAIENENTLYMMIIPNSDKFTFENTDSDIDIGITTTNDYYSIEAKGLESFTLVPGKELTLNGENFDFSATVGVENNGEVGLASVSGNSEKPIFIDCSTNDTAVTSEGKISNITIGAYTPIDKHENSYDYVPSTFSINSEEGTINEKEAHKIDKSKISGDLDDDTNITANDALMVLRASVGLEILTTDQTVVADVDRDSDITANDALAILRYSVGLDTDGNVGKPIAA